MTTYTIPYGDSSLSFDLPRGVPVSVIAPKTFPPVTTPRQVVEETLQRSSLQGFSNLPSVAIAINDKTRPVPHQHLLPPLLKKLESIGIPPRKVTLIIATGAHPPLTEEEFPQVVPPEVLDRCRVISHDCDDYRNLVHLGKTQRNTPVWINRTYAESTLRIVVGNIEPHQFQGFSGGVKSAAIGLAGRETINANHAWMTDPRSCLGAYEDNPARQDVEEIGEILGVHYALNVILNADKKILHALAGKPAQVIEEGIPIARDIYHVEVAAPFDLLIVSPGGHPKDINLYQAQKALAHASRVTKGGGTILLAAACPEGAGDEAFAAWMRESATLEDVLSRFHQKGFRVGPHKAYLFARDATRVNVHIKTDLPSEETKSFHLNPVNTLQTFLDRRFSNQGCIAILPYANATIPKIKQ